MDFTELHLAGLLDLLGAAGIHLVDVDSCVYGGREREMVRRLMSWLDL